MSWDEETEYSYQLKLDSDSQLILGSSKSSRRDCCRLGPNPVVLKRVGAFFNGFK
jgi:hypothetical protein